MHLTPKYINIIINILLGAAWAATFYSFFYGFFHSNSNFFVSILSGIVHMFFGLILVLIVELIYLQFKKYEELKKSNRLLRELTNKK